MLKIYFLFHFFNTHSPIFFFDFCGAPSFFFQHFKKQWEDLVDELCLTPEGPMDKNMSELKNIMTHETSPQKDVELPIGLTIVDIGAVSDRVSELQTLREERFQQITALGQQITQLWKKLDISQEEQDAFFAGSEGQLGTKEIESCQTELSRLAELKKERVLPMMLNERAAITDLWEKLHYSQQQQNQFTSFTITNEDQYTEELVEEHEKYHIQLNEQYDIQKPIMEKIEKREKYLTIPDKLAVPLPKRGDLKEDGKKYSSGEIAKLGQQRAKFQTYYKKYLPKVEEELVNDLTAWKEMYSTDIIIDGAIYLDIVNEGISNRENEGKQKRDKLKAQHMKKFQQVDKKHSTLKRKGKA